MKLPGCGVSVNPAVAAGCVQCRPILPCAFDPISRKVFPAAAGSYPWLGLEGRAGTPLPANALLACAAPHHLAGRLNLFNLTASIYVAKAPGIFLQTF